MIEIIDITQAERWDNIVKGFTMHDVYYLSGYVRPFMLHGDGNPKLLYYESEGLRAIYVFMLRPTDIAELYDSTTPYGYGGILFEGDTCYDHVEAFWKEYASAMIEIGVVDDFVRYHPVLQNAEPLRPFSNIMDLGKTIALDLSSPEVIWENLTSKKRGKIRKAEKNGIQVLHGQGFELFEQFIPIYNTTMKKDAATDYYFFEKPFYEAIYEGLRGNYEMFYAMLDDKVVMMAIMLYCNGQMHYHLSGSLLEYRHFEANNLLLYKAALWGCDHGLKSLHLGGGVGSGNDPLFEFKKGFNRNDDCQFSIGRQVFDEDGYRRLISKRKEIDMKFDETTQFFPAYRANTHEVNGVGNNYVAQAA